MPSPREGFGLVFLEAMRAGKPCLGCPGSASEIIVEGETGFLVRQDDRPALVDRLARLFGIAIWGLFPPTVEAPTEAQRALLSATGDLPEEDLEELQRYADFIRARKTLRRGK